MLFDCVRVNTGLGFHWICNSEGKKKRGGVYVNWWWYQSWTIFLFLTCWSFLIGEHMSWPNMDVTLPFWVIVRSGRWNVMNHIATKGEPYLVVGVRRILLPWVILRREGCHDHIWISIFFVTSVPGWGYALIWDMGGAYPYMGTPQRRGFLGCIKLITPYYLWCLNFGIQVY
jgi:hypothetical protein